MLRAAGYNPMRWDCDKNGCYNTKMRPKIEQFADCFPGSIAMSDVDGVVDVRGRILFIEWKSNGGSLKDGQAYLFEKLTTLSPDEHRVTVLVVHGDPETMVVQTIQVWRAGIAGPVESCDLDQLKVRMKAWADQAFSRWHREQGAP